jgi:hypothetical protein
VLILEIKAKLRIENNAIQRFPLSYILLVQQEDQRRMLSHKNIVSNVLDSASRIPFEAGKPVH